MDMSIGENTAQSEGCQGSVRLEHVRQLLCATIRDAVACVQAIIIRAVTLCHCTGLYYIGHKSIGHNHIGHT